MRDLVRTNREQNTKSTKTNTKGTTIFVLFVFCYVPFVYLPPFVSSRIEPEGSPWIGRILSPILYALGAFLGRTMGTTVHRPLSLDSMADDLAPTMRARWCQGMDGALKAIEDMRLAGHFDFKGFVVFIPAHFAFRHD